MTTTRRTRHRGNLGQTLKSSGREVNFKSFSSSPKHPASFVIFTGRITKVHKRLNASYLKIDCKYKMKNQKNFQDNAVVILQWHHSRMTYFSWPIRNRREELYAFRVVCIVYYPANFEK